MADKQQNDAATTPHDATVLIALALSKVLEHSTYACNDTVKAAEMIENAPAVTIRWDCADSTERLTIPCNNSFAAQSPLDKLLKGTTPTGFGYQGNDVIDESYHKASKLDATTFSTDFCPYEIGIIDIIGQALLPKSPGGFQGIWAVIYKLNVNHCSPYFFWSAEAYNHHRSTKPRLVCSNHTLTPRVQTYSLAHSLYVFHVNMREVSSWFARRTIP